MDASALGYRQLDGNQLHFAVLVFHDFVYLFSLIDHQYAVQVIDLVLEDARQPVVDLDAMHLAMAVLRFDE